MEIGWGGDEGGVWDESEEKGEVEDEWVRWMHVRCV